MEKLPNVYLGNKPHDRRTTFRKKDILKHTLGDRRMVPACTLADMELVAIMAGDFSDKIKRTAANVWKHRCTHARTETDPEGPWVADGDNLAAELLSTGQTPRPEAPEQD